MKPILFVVSEKGYTWDEVILPYLEFRRQGREMVFATPTGARPAPDPLSIKTRPIMNLMGYGTSHAVAPDTEKGKELQARLDQPVALSGASAEDFDGIYIAGGHGSLFDLNRNTDLHGLILDFDRETKPIGTLCHASSTLAYVSRGGESFIADKRVTGFPTLLEHFLLTFRMVHQRFLPLPIWTGRELDGKSRRRSLWLRLWEVLNPWTTVKDGHITTGVGPKVGGQVARRMFDA